MSRPNPSFVPIWMSAKYFDRTGSAEPRSGRRHPGVRGAKFRKPRMGPRCGRLVHLFRPFRATASLDLYLAATVDNT